MKKFSEFITEAKPKIFRNEQTTKWMPDPDALKYGKQVGLTMIGIGELEKIVKEGRDNAFVFFYLFKNERNKGLEFKKDNKNTSEILVRYVTRNTAASGMAPLCILNPDKGYMRFIENIDEDPELEDAEWSKPQKFNYLRTTI